VFQWHGREYPLQEGDGRGNAIHGFVHTRPWRLTAQSAQEVTAEFQASVDDAELLEHWPGDFRIQGTYRIDGTCLASRFTVHNPGQDPLPCGFGTHPYFRLPLGPTGSSAPCRLHLPLTHRWELKEMVATGQKLPLPMADQWAQGVELGDTNFDDVLTGLQERDGQHWAAISDPQNDCQLTITFSRRFRECVVYTPGHREAVCIEPYTCVPDAARLAEQGVDAGLMVLAPGESVELQVAMEFRA
jgi:aldose 1-epimerase